MSEINDALVFFTVAFVALCWLAMRLMKND